MSDKGCVGVRGTTSVVPICPTDCYSERSWIVRIYERSNAVEEAAFRLHPVKVDSIIGHFRKT